MTEGLWAAIIGVGGTLLGTALGWWLNTLSNRGKIDVFCKKWDVEFETNINGILARTEDIEKAEYFDFNVELEVVNHSSDIKIIREVQILFEDFNGKILEAVIPNDTSLRTYSNHHYFHKEVKPFNVYGKSIISINLDKGFNNSNSKFDFVFNTEKIFLQYKDEANNIKRVLLKEGNVKDYYSIKDEGENNA